jgi:succinate dehydrogenase / fumarate reductase membrane anchor subunit
MVTRVTSLGKNGLYDWLIQRGTALVLGIYTLCVISFLIGHSDLNHATWHAYMTSGSMKIFTFLALISVAAHAWVGLWTVVGDYLTTRQLGSPATAIRAAALGVVAIVTVIYVVWGVQIIWGA